MLQDLYSKYKFIETRLSQSKANMKGIQFIFSVFDFIRSLPDLIPTKGKCQRFGKLLRP